MTTPDETAAGAGRTGDAPDRARRVVLVVEQLRRAVPGGIGRYITGLLQGLAEMTAAGQDVPELTLHASRPPKSLTGARGDPLAAYGWPVVASVLPGPILTRGWDRAVVDVGGRDDVVHALSLAAPPARRAPLVVTIHDLAWRQVPGAFPPRGQRWHEAAFRRARRRASRIVVPSEAVAAAVLSAGVRAASVAVIPHGTDHLPVPDRSSTAALLDRLGVEGEFLLSVGTLEPRKNLARLVEAYGRARPRLPEPWPLVVVGPRGWGGSAAVAGDAEAGVVATGPVGDGVLAGLYDRARLLAYVPLTEGFGFPPVEAMRQGLPVVASPMPSLEGAGLVVDPESVDEIATGLVSAAADEGLRAELRAGGMERTAPQRWSVSARAHVALWESVR